MMFPIKETKPGIYSVFWDNGEKMDAFQSADYFRYCQFMFKLI